jgi:NAD(P)-dependent dehydrogenase (short-subunit alcohol dehydrogenase family)
MIVGEKTIIITGISSGIGATTGSLLEAHGTRIIGVDINQPKSFSGEFFQADLSNQASIDKLVEQLPAGAHGLVNCAGLPPTRPPEAVVAVNLVGLKYLTLKLIPKLADGTSIVNLASLAGLGWPNAKSDIDAAANLSFGDIAAFCTAHNIVGGRSYFFTKEALIVWTMQNRWTWRDRGIRMNAISPGPVETPILKDFLETLGERAEEDMRVMDRPGVPMDIAQVIAFLLSDNSGWIRGANIPVDGGMFSHVQCQMHGY